MAEVLIIKGGDDGPTVHQRSGDPDLIAKSMGGAGAVETFSVRGVRFESGPMSRFWGSWARSERIAVVAPVGTKAVLRDLIAKAVAAGEAPDDASAQFDSGGLAKGVLLRVLGAEGAPEEHAIVTGEVFRKAEDPDDDDLDELADEGADLTDPRVRKGALLRPGGGKEIVRKAYGAWMSGDGSVDLKKATAELDELVRNLENRGLER